MWHEARKQEKKIRGMLVDYRKRAERRQDFYERIKADPTQFLQVHGRKCKIHLDASVATAAENPAIMMPWQGQKENLIDRFDVRAHLDYIPPVPRSETTDAPTEQADDTERSMNYERFRVLAQNEFLGIVEEKYLHQLHLEEQFGVNAQVEAETKAASAASKKKSAAGAAIGYTYEETDTVVAGSSGTGGSIGSSMAGTSSSVPFAQSITAIEKSADSAPQAGTSGAASSSARYDECMKDESDSDLDMDVSIDINKIGTVQAHELNACGRQYGMKSNDFYSFLTKDADEADALRMAREEEQEKIMFSGRKSRRERRAQRERKFAGRPLSPPSYAAKEELLPRTLVETNDSSRSPSPINSGKITYITSFGGEDELQAHGKVSFGFSRDMSTLGGIAAGTSKAARLRAEAAGGEAGGGALSYAEKVKQNLEKLKAQQPKESDKKPPVQYQRSAETSRGRRGRGSSRRSSSSGSSRSPPRRSRGRRSSRSSSSSSSDSSSSSPASRKRGTVADRRPQRSRAEKTGDRNRSPARVGGPSARSGGRHATYSRYRRRSRSSASRSRSVSRSRSRSRTRGRRRSPPARARKGHSRRSSSSTSRSSRSRSRTPAGRRQRTPTTRAPGGGDSSDGSLEKPRAPTAGVPQERKVATLPTIVPSPILTALPPPPPPPLPPASTGASLSTAGSAVVDEKKPIPSLALIEPEPEVPIKRYYGRRRGDESSSDDSSTSDGDRDTNGAAEERKPAPQALAGHDPPWGDGDDGTSGTGPAGSSKLASGFTDTMVQIKQEKLDSSTGPTTASCGTGASLRFGKTVPGGTSAPESKVSTGIVTGAASASKPGSSVNPRDRLKRKMQILLNKQYKADKKAEIEKVERQIQQQQERDDEMRELALKLRRRQRELRHKYGTPESDHSKSHSSDERSTGDEDEAAGGSHVKQQPPPRFGHSSTAREGSRSPQRQPLLSSPLASIAAPRLTRPPPSLRVESLSAVPSYRNSAVIERKPVLRSATDSGPSPQVPPVTMYSGPGGDVGRLRRRNSPAIGGSTGYRTQQSVPVSSHSMSLRRGAGGGGGVPDTVSGPAGSGHRPSAPPGGGRFDDRNRRRSPPTRYNRSRSKSRERMPSARDTSTAPGRGRGGRRTEYPGRSRDYDRPHGYAGGGGGGGGGGSHSGFSASSSGGGGGGGGGGGRYRGGRRSRSGSRGRRSRSPGRRSGSPARGRGNGGGGGALVGAGTSSSKSGSTSTASRQTEPRAVKKLVDY
ncbi:CLK4-associating serine/arginine rich protein-like [Anopheles bellator]|uniref:CLK4-associating serine/arginine rich protein-like n=1 Tax=Anopheles bellator TaxID=139047 RepID=UPI002649F47A|nr:CLK4-associating serine/arginine rich protein-like [Anopheles bellator]